MKELVSIGVAANEPDINQMVFQGKGWIVKEETQRQPQLDLFGEERQLR